MRAFNEQSIRRIGNVVRAVERDGGGGVRRRGKLDDAGVAMNTALFGIIIDNAEQRVQVLTRRVVRQTAAGPETLFTLPNTYLDLSSGVVGTNTIYLNFDPSEAESAGVNPAVSFAAGEVNSYRLYGLEIAESGSPSVRSARLLRVASPGDEPPHFPHYPEPPTVEGVYFLKASVDAGGNATFTWEEFETFVCPGGGS